MCHINGKLNGSDISFDFLLPIKLNDVKMLLYVSKIRVTMYFLLLQLVLVLIIRKVTVTRKPPPDHCMCSETSRGLSVTVHI